MGITIGITLAATAIVVVAGYLVGVRRARDARTEAVRATRDEMRDAQRLAELERDALSARATEAEQARDALAERAAAAEERAAELAVEVKAGAARDATTRTLSAQLRAITPRGDAIESAVRDVLGPFVERERAHQALLALDPGHDLGDLPDVLQRIARAGRFATVLLSDESGLPIASGGQAEALEASSAVYSLLMTLADRLAYAGAPAPRSLVIRDDDGRSTVHRIFRVGRERYLLSAVSRQGALTPDALDPALPSLEATLARRAA